MKARTSMKEQRDLENLLKQDSSGPAIAEDTDTSSNKSSETEIPMGNDDEKSLSTEAELSILEKKKAAGLTKSQQNTPKLDVVDEYVEAELPRNSSSDNLRNSSKSVKSSIKRSMRRDSSSSSLRNSGTSVISKRRTGSQRNSYSVSVLITTAQKDEASIRRVHSSDDLRSLHDSDIPNVRASMRSSSNQRKVGSSMRRSSSGTKSSVRASMRRSSTSAKRNSSLQSNGSFS